MLTRDAIDADALADFTLQLVGAASPSGEEGAVARLVAEEMERLGLRTEVDALGNVTGTIEAGPGPTVLIDSHMDTVGVTEPDAWNHSPTGERVGGRLYGRGTMDMKGPLAASLHGAAALRHTLRRGKVVVSASVAEEMVEGPALAALAQHLHPDYVIICEATSLQLAQGQRGRAEIRVEVSGRPSHSSRPDLGINAAEAMVDVIMALRALPAPRHPVLGAGILVLTDIISRPYPGLSVVPDYCVATFDRRTLPGETEESVLAPIRTAVNRALAETGATGQVAIAEDDFQTYTGAEIRAPNFAPAWFSPESSPIVRRVLAGMERAGLPPTLTHYAFCTNGSGTAGRLGIPTVGFGPGDEALAHRSDEYVEIDDLVAAARGYASITQSLTEGE